jgi:DNA-binding NtrC family response regulator
VEARVARILLVEDLSELRQELRSAVDASHETCDACSAREALGRLDEQAFDLVICALVLETGDYMEDGLAVVRKATRSVPPAHAIIVASYSTPRTCVDAIEAGVYDYVERNSPGIDFVRLLRHKVSSALARPRTVVVAKS